ncbi:MAG TPA: sugar ABC transporter permease [Myxococcales bacterium]|nr:sugar ABC transporter permease [Myxococcales bacterium]
MRRAPTLAVVLGHLAAIVATAAALYPVLWVVKMALGPSQAFDQSPNPWPSHWSLQNFRDLWGAGSAGHLWRQLGNSCVVALATAVVGLASSATAAYAFSRLRFRGRQGSLAFFLATQMFPGTMMAIPLYILLDDLHLLDSLLGLVLVYSTTAVPFCVWTLKGYLDTLPRELDEAARIDGASSWQIFTRVVLPLARPALAVTALFAFLSAWNEYILAATFLGDERTFTLPVALQRYVGEYHTEWGHFAAGALVVSLPVMLVFFALQKQLVAGLTAGGVKG